jgi:hypothetical protein
MNTKGGISSTQLRSPFPMPKLTRAANQERMFRLLAEYVTMRQGYNRRLHLHLLSSVPIIDLSTGMLLLEGYVLLLFTSALATRLLLFSYCVEIVEIGIGFCSVHRTVVIFQG